MREDRLGFPCPRLTRRIPRRRRTWPPTIPLPASSPKVSYSGVMNDESHQIVVMTPNENFWYSHGNMEDLETHT